MTWANVDDLFPEHPKVLAAGGDAAWLYICGLCFTNRNLTEGRIPKAMVPRLSDRKNPLKLAQVLVDVGLWHDQRTHYAINDWANYNEDAATVKARKEQARKAAQTRWAGKPKGPPSDAQSNADRNAGSNAQSNAGANAELSDQQCPPTPLPLVTSSSSNHSGGGMAAGEEEEHPEVRATAMLVAQRRLVVRDGPPITNTSAWLAKTARDVMDKHGQAMYSMQAEGMDVIAMADRIMPPIVSPYPNAGADRGPAWDEAEDERGHLIAVPRRTG